MKNLFICFAISMLAQSQASEASATHDFLNRTTDSKKIEFFWSKPAGSGPFPFLLLIHPDQESPKAGGKSFVDSGQLDYWTKKGFVAAAISQPGYGESDGPADFCGPRSQQSAVDVIHFFKSKAGLISGRTFLYGGSRGAAVASMVGAREPSLSGVILKSGVYDFLQWSKLRPWYDPIKLTMLWEIGWPSDDKLTARSAIYLAGQIKSPVLIIHGTQDSRAPLALAEQFYGAINKVGGHAELVKIESEHVIPMAKIDQLMTSFMSKY
jgi:dipeptidyl aminopeptidase/acylaminoacyl peptidase